MPKLPIISGDKAVQVLEKIGFIKYRQTGSHVILKRLTSEGEIVCVVPRHRELKIGTLRGVLRQAEISPDEFIKHFRV